MDPEEVVTQFKRRGLFDELRRKMFQEFMEGVSLILGVSPLL